MADSKNIVECTEKGLTKRPIDEKSNKWGGYIIYRPMRSEVSQSAGTAAELLSDTHRANGALPYNYVGAAASVLVRSQTPKSAIQMDQIFEQIIKKSKRGTFRMYCSQFVVYLFQWIGTQMGLSSSYYFNVNDERISPAVLAGLLADSSHFEEIVYLIANQR